MKQIVTVDTGTKRDKQRAARKKKAQEKYLRNLGSYYNSEPIRKRIPKPQE